ncbi:hypothetical protein KR054_010726 [Drosophila jambulina]|nr:hypothetical protein KR054_010726 [Drosophila jambulina]
MEDCISILGGEFQILRVTPSLYEESAELLVSQCLYQEFGCLSANLKDSPLAVAEFRQWIRYILSHGISFAIRHVDSGRVVSAITNIIMVGFIRHTLLTKQRTKNFSLIQNENRRSSSCDIVALFKSPNMLKYRKFWDDVELSYDMNSECQLDVVMYVEYLATLPDFRKLGLACILCQHTIDFGRLMSQQRLPPKVLCQLSEEMQIEVPEALSTIATSLISQKMGHRLGLTVAHRWHISDLKALGLDLANLSKGFEHAEIQVLRF